MMFQYNGEVENVKGKMKPPGSYLLIIEAYEICQRCLLIVEN